jgi:hypothetical protein
MQASGCSRCLEARSTTLKASIGSLSLLQTARHRHVGPLRASSNGYSNGTAPAAAQPAGSAPTVYEEVPGPLNAFVPGQESESRRQLFNRISPVYDEVGWSGRVSGKVLGRGGGGAFAHGGCRWSPWCERQYLHGENNGFIGGVCGEGQALRCCRSAQQPVVCSFRPPPCQPPSRQFTGRGRNRGIGTCFFGNGHSPCSPPGPVAACLL